MSSRELRWVRPSKGKDKDGDKRSSIHGTGGIIIKKHRESTTSRSVASLDSSSQACDGAQSQASNDILTPDSTHSSPLLRTSSAVSLPSKPSPRSLQTPAALQPYLENDASELADTSTQDVSGDSYEATRGAIQFLDGADGTGEGLEDSRTPIPNRRVQSDGKSKEPESSAPTGPEGLYENPFLSSHMNDSFPANTLHSAPPMVPPPPMPAQPYMQPHPRAPSSPAESWHDASSQRSTSVASANRSATSDPSSTTTVIGQPPGPLFQPRENPMMLLQRVSSAMPDIFMLMQNFHESCATLGMRENHIRQLEAQREADAKRQDKNIDNLTREIEALLAKHSAKVDRLEMKVSILEESKASLQKNLAKEVRAKEDLKANCEKLRIEQQHLAIKYLGEKEEMAESHAQETSRLISDHAANQRALSDHAQAQAHIAEVTMASRLSELTTLHDDERQMLNERRTQERMELQDGHAKVRRNLEDTLAARLSTIEEERLDCTRMKQAYEKENSELRFRLDQERGSHRQELENHTLESKKSQKENDEVIKAMDASRASQLAKSQAVIREQEELLGFHSHQVSETQNTISSLRKDAETHKSHAAEIQEAFRKLQKEHAEMRIAFETMQSRHLQQAEVQQQPLQQQDRTRKIHSSNDIQNRSRTPSRQRSDPQETIKLRRDLENERGRNEAAQDTINKLRRELDGLRSHGTTAVTVEKKHVQHSSSSSSSPSLSKVLPEHKSSLQKTTSNESRGASQK